MRNQAVGALVVWLLAGCAEPEVLFSRDQFWTSPSTYPGVGNGRVLVVNNREDSVSLFDLETIAEPSAGELLRVPVGLNAVELEGPHHAASDPLGEYFYVGISNYVPGAGSGPHGLHGSGTADGYALKYRAADNLLVASVRLDPNPGDIILSKDGSTLYATHFDLLKIADAVQRQAPPSEMDARLAIVDTATMERRAMVDVCPAPHGVQLSSDEKRVYVACRSDELAVVQLDDPDYPVTRVKIAPNAGDAVVPVHEPYALAVAPNGDVWVSSLRSGELHVVDPGTLQPDPARRRYLGGPLLFGSFSADGTTYYVPVQGEDDIALVDTSSGAVLDRWDLSATSCLSVHQVLLLEAAQQVLAVCEGDHRTPGSLLVLELGSGVVLRDHPVGIYPDYVGLLTKP